LFESTENTGSVDKIQPYPILSFYLGMGISVCGGILKETVEKTFWPAEVGSYEWEVVVCHRGGNLSRPEE